MTTAPLTDDRTAAIRYLAAWALRLRTESDQTRGKPDALRCLVEVAGRHGSRALTDFRVAARRSADLLAPLGEPLSALDFTAHRWMASHREEAYSDWLQWFLSEADASEVLAVFGVNDREMVSACNASEVRIVRERRVLQGHEGSSGRLDLEIRFGSEALLVVEIKLDDAEGADTAKGEGYRRSVEDELSSWNLKKYVILVLDAGEEEYFGFRPRLWADACTGLRLMAASSCRRGEYLRAAMTLAFVAAVEQNLLGLRPATKLDSDGVTTALSLSRATEHLSRFLEASDDVEEDSDQ